MFICLTLTSTLTLAVIRLTAERVCIGTEIALFKKAGE